MLNSDRIPTVESLNADGDEEPPATLARSACGHGIAATGATEPCHPLVLQS